MASSCVVYSRRLFNAVSLAASPSFNIDNYLDSSLKVNRDITSDISVNKEHTLPCYRAAVGTLSRVFFFFFNILAQCSTVSEY